MLKVTEQAAGLLRATAQATEGVTSEAGIRIRRDGTSRDPHTIRVGLDICDGPEPGDMELEESGLRIFVEDGLKEPLDDRTLDIRNTGSKPEFVFLARPIAANSRLS
jgi:Fe-S cluster assembly iron-binding protein IscA